MTKTEQKDAKRVDVDIRLSLPSDLHEAFLDEEERYKVPLGVMLSGFLVQLDIMRKESGVQCDLSSNINWMQVSDAAPWLIEGDE